MKKETYVKVLVKEDKYTCLRVSNLFSFHFFYIGLLFHRSPFSK